MLSKLYSLLGIKKSPPLETYWDNRGFYYRLPPMGEEEKEILDKINNQGHYEDEDFSYYIKEGRAYANPKVVASSCYSSNSNDYVITENTHIIITD